jgi:hypothetical protein
MKKRWNRLVELHWKAFMWNGAYFLLTLIPVLLYAFTRLTWYKSQGKNFWGRTPEQSKEESKKIIEEGMSVIPFFENLNNY